MSAVELVNGGAIGVVIILVGGFWRALLRGDIVLGREYTRAIDDSKAITVRADTAVAEAKASADRERERTDRLILDQAAELARMRGENTKVKGVTP